MKIKTIIFASLKNLPCAYLFVFPLSRPQTGWMTTGFTLCSGQSEPACQSSTLCGGTAQALKYTHRLVHLTVKTHWHLVDKVCTNRTAKWRVVTESVARYIAKAPNPRQPSKCLYITYSDVSVMRGVQVPQEMWKAFKGLKNLDVVFNIQTVL